MKIKDAVAYMRLRYTTTAHPAAHGCELCDAIDTLIKAAEMANGFVLAAKWDAVMESCSSCPLYDACKKAPAGHAPFGLLMCENAAKYLDLWVAAARKEVTR